MGSIFGKLVLVGSSAGGHLALYHRARAGVGGASDRLCPGDESLLHRGPAVVNFFGIFRRVEALFGAALDARFCLGVGWMGGEYRKSGTGSSRYRPHCLRSRRSAPAVFTVHGDSDPVVPFAQATKLHAALDGVGVPNQLYVVKGGHHGDFHGDDVMRISHAVRDFLLKRGVIAGGKRWYEMPPAPLIVRNDLWALAQRIWGRVTLTG